MRKDTDNDFFKIMKGALIACAVILFICFACSSCSFKNKSNKSMDAKEETAKVDTGSVKKKEVETKKDSEYERNVFIPVYPPRDTTINNFYPSQSKPDYIIIQEKGRASEVVKETNQDSTWNNRMNQLLTALTTKKTETEASVLGIGFWLGISGFVLVLIILLFALLHFKNQIVSIKNLLPKN